MSANIETSFSVFKKKTLTFKKAHNFIPLTDFESEDLIIRKIALHNW